MITAAHGRAAGEDEAVVNREDLQDALTLIALHVPLEFRPQAILDRLQAAAEEGR